MSLKLLIDMNLSPDWIAYLSQEGVYGIHWSSIGDPTASDDAIMSWARDNRYVVFTHDLDFSALLALTREAGPSVIQVRTQVPMPEHIGAMVIAALRQHATDLMAGALLVIDEARSRVRLLPL